MVRRKVPVSAHLTWDDNDYKRVVAYFALLVQIDRRMARAQGSQPAPAPEEPKKTKSERH